MIAIISSTNRKGANSFKLAKIYQKEFQKKGVESTLLDLEKLPDDFLHTTLYENNGKNESFNQMLHVLNEATKVIFVIPEYNGSYPGILKTFIDALPYPNTLKGKKAALSGISSSGNSAVLALSHFTDVLHYLGCTVCCDKVRIPGIENILLEEGITDQTTINRIDRQIDAFLEM